MQPAAAQPAILRSDRAGNDSAAGNLPALARRRFPPLGVWIVAAVCAAGIVWVRQFADIPLFDAAVRNIITLILGFVALMTVLIWFAWRSAYSRRVRLAPVVLAAIAVVGTAATRRIDSYDGGMVPSSRWRWQPKPDQLLPPATPVAETSAVDLLATTPDDYPQFLGPNRNATIETVRLRATGAPGRQSCCGASRSAPVARPLRLSATTP